MAENNYYIPNKLYNDVKNSIMMLKLLWLRSKNLKMLTVWHSIKMVWILVHKGI